MKTYIIFVLFLLAFLSPKAQLAIKLYDDSTYIAGLEKAYASAVSDSIKAYKAFQLSYAYKRAKNPAKSKQYLEKGIVLAKENSFLMAASHYYRGFMLLGAADLDSVRIDFRKGDSLLSMFKTPEAFKIRSNAWVALGVIEQMKGSEQKGLEAYINHALPLAKNSGDSFTIANANKFVGISLLNAEEREKANTYLEHSLRLFEQAVGESPEVQQTAIVEVSIILAENNTYLNQLTTAKTFLDKAKNVLAPYPQSNAYLFYYHAEGTYYSKLGDYEKAIGSFDKGIALTAGTAENYYINRMKFGKFETLRKMEKNSEAIAVMQNLLKSAIILPQDKYSYFGLLASTYAETGNFKAAYNWLQKHGAISDSLNVSTYRAKMIELEKKYETSEKEKQIAGLQAEKQEAMLTQKNQRLLNWLFGAGAMVFLLGLIFLAYIYKNAKRNAAHKLKEITQEKELQVTQAILEGEERERQRIARDLHDGLGSTLSGIKIKLSGQRKNTALPVLDEMILQLEHAIRELRRISRNLMPATLIRSGLETALSDLCASLASEDITIQLQSNGIQKNIPVNTQVGIYRIVQELLNNAIRHGKASNVIVQCLQNEEILLITVEDNGVGFAGTAKNGSDGMGLTNVRNRVQYMKGKMEIDSAVNQGTTINIELAI